PPELVLHEVPATDLDRRPHARVVEVDPRGEPDREAAHPRVDEPPEEPVDREEGADLRDHLVHRREGRSPGMVWVSRTGTFRFRRAASVISFRRAMSAARTSSTGVPESAAIVSTSTESSIEGSRTTSSRYRSAWAVGC